MKLTRIILILNLAVMAAVNVYLDHPFSSVHFQAIALTGACAAATALPSLIAYLVSARTVFSIYRINIYQLAADFILLLSTAIWIYLLLIAERPEYYEGASHMYIATLPIAIGILAAGLYIVCLTVQLACWLMKKLRA
ncbi:hypothetical protein ACWJJH_04495 [Endozoicomonadaceae bacterium StTr2]